MRERTDRRRAAALRSDEVTASLARSLQDGSTPVDYLDEMARQVDRKSQATVNRSVSYAAAVDELRLRRFKEAAREYLADKVVPQGYARKPPNVGMDRSAVVLLSDLHIGANLSGRDNPRAYTEVEEARRLEAVLLQVLGFKPHYRRHTELVLLLNGDLVQGYLLKDLRSGAPLIEQKVAFWRYFSAFMAHCAAEFPRVRVHCQPGNHGRDMVRHPGRAVAQKWDGHEWEMYYALREMCARLVNVTWDIPFQAVGVVDLYGKKLLLTHGDTDVAIGDPDTQAERNTARIDRINNSELYGCRFDVAAFGHWHKPRYQPGRTDVIFNGALLPPDGYMRTIGATDVKCGQFLWEAVPGHPVGDVRFVEVGPEQDRDVSLGQIIKPFRFAD